MDKRNDVTDSEIPLGLGMAFSKNSDAMKYFSSLSMAQQQAVIDRAHAVRSKSEMQSFVDALGKNEASS
ncbi:MAG: hypothetical protein GX851_01250 [Clostridiales bacterium]|nr:hypothetical protein [Clostridiales bacterium]